MQGIGKLFAVSSNQRFGWLAKRLLDGGIRHITLEDPQAQTVGTDKPTNRLIDAVEKRPKKGSDIRAHNGIDDDDLPLFALYKERRLYVYGAGEMFTVLAKNSVEDRVDAYCTFT